MSRRCPNPNCKQEPSLLTAGDHRNPRFRPIIRKGSFYRKHDRRFITRYYCRNCGQHFSSSTHSSDYRQKRPSINSKVVELFASSMSQRRMALYLKANPKTIVRKFRLMALRARNAHETRLLQLRKIPILEVQFDDLETFEHTKCKPLSVALAVEKKSREILHFEVSRMPARGPLAAISRKKYGYRMDERTQGWNRMFESLKQILHPNATVESDQNPHYPRFINKHLRSALHIRHPGARGAITGQGELKKLKFDPLFSLNHTCAMLRANLNRLVRRTWATTKKPEGLIDHLWLYLWFHNSVLIQR
jgi:hypothetical protein